MFIEIRFLQTRYQLKKKLLFSEVKDTQFRESSPLHCKTDSEASRTYNPKNNQRPLQTGIHRLPFEYLTEDGPYKTDQRNSYQQDSCNVHHNGRQRRSRQYHISHREKEMRAAPPPTATAIAANNNATNTTPNTNSTGLQIMANITRQISRTSRQSSPMHLPTSARKYGVCPTSYNHSPHWQPSQNRPSPSFRYSLP